MPSQDSEDRVVVYHLVRKRRRVRLALPPPRGPAPPSESTPGEHHDVRRSSSALLALGALGIVFGDIGTSPLYTMREAFGHGALPLVERAILGVVSLVLWALIIVVTLKYVVVIMRADNRGEGGVLALATLAQRGLLGRPRVRNATVVLAMIGAALFYGDGIITPAISVLSAVEGLRIATPLFDPYIVPLAATILAALFLLQRRGTSRVGGLFGPIMAVWFAVLGLLGLIEILDNPGVLRAANPLYGLALFAEQPWAAFVSLGAVVLAVTGAEALYADMGHFGRLPIRAAWFSIVLPGLVLNYFGQGALLIRDPTAISNPFYLLTPSWATLPMVLLATVATIIASQAVISGVFSLTQQAVQLGYIPRIEIRHTSAAEFGQVYVPRINWLLMVAVLAVVLSFQSSSGLAAAYGVAVTGAMAIDGSLAYLTARTRWHWPFLLAVAVFGFFLFVDLTFFAANALKIPSGGWFPIALAALAYVLMSTWRKGRRVLVERLSRDAPSLKAFAARMAAHPPLRVPGDAVYLTSNNAVVPHALRQNLRHNKVLHDCVVVCTVMTEDVPWVRERNRIELERLPANVHRVKLRYGFLERPDVPVALAQCRLIDRDLALDDVTFYLSRETLIASTRPDLSFWRERVFIFLYGLATPAHEFFHLPPDNVIEVGTHIEI